MDHLLYESLSGWVVFREAQQPAPDKRSAMDIAVAQNGMVVLAYHRDKRIFVQYQPGTNEVDVVQELVDQGFLTPPPAEWESYLDELSDVRCAFKGDVIQLLVVSKPYSFWLTRDYSGQQAFSAWQVHYFSTPT